MSKYKAYFNEYFLDKNPLQYLKENNTGEIGEDECLFENFHENKEWFLYEGENNITAVFEDNSRQTFKVHFHENRGEDKHKHRTKAARTWKKLATEIRKNAGLNEVGNPIIIPWQECFQRALQDPLMKEFVDDLSATPIFENINEMSFNDLRQSMKKYKTRADINNGTKTGSRSRERGAKSVNTKSLRVISTVGKDNKERETSLFSYKSGGSSNRWQGFIRFLEGFDEGTDGEVEVNCNCPDYRYVWAEPNADAGAGVTQKDGEFKAQSGFTGSGNENDPSKNQGIRNPNKTPGLCKHLIALASYLETAAAKVAPAKADKEEPSAVAPKTDKPKKPMNVFPSQPTSSTGEKPINIFETMKQFALQNPTFDVSYD